jgi:hypothetical protein
MTIGGDRALGCTNIRLTGGSGGEGASGWFERCVGGSGEFGRSATIFDAEGTEGRGEPRRVTVSDRWRRCIDG